MSQLLCVPVLLFLFLLRESQGASSENGVSGDKVQEQVPMFHMEISGTITKYYVEMESNAYKYAASKNAGKFTKIILYKDGKVLAKKHVDWFGGTYKLEVDIPESEKIGDYELVARSLLYKDKHIWFYVGSSDKSPYKLDRNATITQSNMYEKHHDGQVVWHPEAPPAGQRFNWTYL